MDNKFKPLNAEYKDTVLSFDVSMLKVSDLMKAVKRSMEEKGLETLKNTLKDRGGISENDQDWYGQGVNCEILKPGNKNWKKGKIKINIILEFCSDEPENEEPTPSNDVRSNQIISPLDDIRQKMNKDN